MGATAQAMENIIGTVEDIFAKDISCTWTPFIKFVERTAPAKQPDTLTLFEPACRVGSVAGRSEGGALSTLLLRRDSLQYIRSLCSQSVLLLKPVFFHLVTGCNFAIELYCCV